MRCLASRFCQVAVPNRIIKTSRRHIGRSQRLPVVATSEFWWEDEQEFDALTEVLLPKQVYITTPSGCQQQLQQLKDTTQFVAAFTSPALQEDVEQLWQQLGRAGPPLFLKVRARTSLQECDQDGSSAAAAAAEQFWQELTSQSWRTELDYGISKDTTTLAANEQLLVVMASQQGMDGLLQAATGDGSSNSSSSCSGSGSGSDGVVLVQFEGWNQGATQQQLSSWKQLSPKLQQLPKVALQQ